MPRRQAVNRPSGTGDAFNLAYIPSSELLGYYQSSLRDGDPRIDICVTTTGQARR
jgi:hypothetical protein